MMETFEPSFEQSIECGPLQHGLNASAMGDFRLRRDHKASATDEDWTHLCPGHAGGPGGRGSGTGCPCLAQAGGGSRGRLPAREGRDRSRRDSPQRRKCCTAAIPDHRAPRRTSGREGRRPKLRGGDRQCAPREGARRPCRGSMTLRGARRAADVTKRYGANP